MRWMVFLAAAVAIFGWNGPRQAAAQHGGYPSPCHECSHQGSRCGRCGGLLQHRLAAKKAAVGYFNCQCRGSYKFPVPPQYTYHWPGMYSQQTMTQYNSPYRFPPLNPPERAFGPKDEDIEGDAPIPPTAGASLDGGKKDGSRLRWMAPSKPRQLPVAAPSADGSAKPVIPSRLMKSFYGVQ